MMRRKEINREREQRRRHQRMFSKGMNEISEKEGRKEGKKK